MRIAPGRASPLVLKDSGISPKVIRQELNRLDLPDAFANYLRSRALIEPIEKVFEISPGLKWQALTPRQQAQLVAQVNRLNQVTYLKGTTTIYDQETNSWLVDLANPELVLSLELYFSTLGYRLVRDSRDNLYVVGSKITIETTETDSGHTTLDADNTINLLKGEAVVNSNQAFQNCLLMIRSFGYVHNLHRTELIG